MPSFKPSAWAGGRFAPELTIEEYKIRCRETTQQELSALVHSPEFKRRKWSKLRSFVQSLVEAWPALLVICLLGLGGCMSWVTLIKKGLAVPVEVSTPQPSPFSHIENLEQLNGEKIASSTIITMEQSDAKRSVKRKPCKKGRPAVPADTTLQSHDHQLPASNHAKTSDSGSTVSAGVDEAIFGVGQATPDTGEQAVDVEPRQPEQENEFPTQEVPSLERTQVKSKVEPTKDEPEEPTETGPEVEPAEAEQETVEQPETGTESEGTDTSLQVMSLWLILLLALDVAWSLVLARWGAVKQAVAAEDDATALIPFRQMSSHLGSFPSRLTPDGCITPMPKHLEGVRFQAPATADQRHMLNLQEQVLELQQELRDRDSRLQSQRTVMDTIQGCLMETNDINKASQIRINQLEQQVDDLQAEVLAKGQDVAVMSALVKPEGEESADILNRTRSGIQTAFSTEPKTAARSYIDSSKKSIASLSSFNTPQTGDSSRSDASLVGVAYTNSSAHSDYNQDFDGKENAHTICGDNIGSRATDPSKEDQRLVAYPLLD